MIGAWFGLQAAVLATVGVAYALVWAVPAEARRLQRLALLAVPVALLAAMSPGERPFTPAAQVWAPAAGEAAPRVAILSAPAVPVAPAAAVPLGSAVLLLGLWPAGRALLGLRRQLRGARRLRRIRGVEVWLAPNASGPFAVWLGRPVVVLDPDSAFDAELAVLAVRHELQHHRQGDPQVAWALVALTLVAPVAAALRRPFAEAEELSVDRALLARGVAARPYAAALARLALRPAAPSALARGMGAFLPRRLRMLLLPAPRRPVRLAAARLSVAALVFAAAPLGFAADGVARDHRLDPARFTAAAERLDAGGAFVGATNPAVAAAVDALVATPNGRAWAERSLAAAATVRPTVLAALAAADLPPELAAVPFVESGYRNRAAADLPSTVPPGQRGAGFWMFIAPTARAYGLRVDETVDERTDLARETAAAVALLRTDYARYGDWGLTLAAYNQGESAVDAAVAAGRSRDVFVLQAAGRLNDYVAQVYAAEMVIEDPSLLR